MKKQIAALVFALPSLSMGSLVAWYPLDGDASDASGNGFDGFVVGGGISFGQAGANGATGQSADFTGTGHIEIPWDPALNTQDFTVTLWANADLAGGGSFRSPITNRDDVAPGGAFRHGWIIYNNSAGNWSFWNGGGTSGDGAWNVADGPAVATNAWTHVAITYDSATNTKVIYINGVAVSTTNPVAFSPNNGDLLDGFPHTHENEDLHIGGGGDDGSAFRWDGLIDDVSIWDEALDQAAIQDIQLNSITIIPEPTSLGLLSLAGFGLLRRRRS
jgi:hypothetical protein